MPKYPLKAPRPVGILREVPKRKVPAKKITGKGRRFSELLRSAETPAQKKLLREFVLFLACPNSEKRKASAGNFRQVKTDKLPDMFMLGPEVSIYTGLHEAMENASALDIIVGNEKISLDTILKDIGKYKRLFGKSRRLVLKRGQPLE